MEFALAQGLGQAAGMISGLIFVRIMPVEEYALYALSLTASAFIIVGTDLGQGSALMYFWHKYRSSRGSVAKRLAAIRTLRQLSFAIAFLLAGFIYVRSVTTTSASLEIAALCFVVGAITAWLQGTSTIDNLVMRLEGRQRESYFSDSASAGIRLLVAFAALIAGMASAVLGMFAGLFGALGGLCLTRRMRSADFRELPPATRGEVGEVGRQILPLLPSFGIFIIQGPIIYWLAAVQGGPQVVAESHALGRIAAILSLLGTITSVVIAPRLAMRATYSSWLHGVVLSAVAIVVSGLAAVSAAAAWPDVPLRLLGPAYGHLKLEVVLSIAAAAITVLNGLLVVSTRMRGWVSLEPAVAVCQTAVFSLLLGIISFQTTRDVMTVSLIFTSCSTAFAMSVLIAGHFWPRLVAEPLTTDNAKDY